MSTQHNARPGGHGTGADDLVGTGPVAPIVPATTPDQPADTAAFREAFGIVVRGKSVRRHLYFNLPAAEPCVRRARARGDQAEMVLVRLVPVRDGAA